MKNFQTISDTTSLQSNGFHKIFSLSQVKKYLLSSFVNSVYVLPHLIFVNSGQKLRKSTYQSFLAFGKIFFHRFWVFKKFKN